MKLTNMITKLFGYLKLSSLAFVVLLGVYGIILQKGDLSIWRPENRNQFYYSGGHCSSKSVINGLRLEFRFKNSLKVSIKMVNYFSLVQKTSALDFIQDRCHSVTYLCCDLCMAWTILYGPYNIVDIISIILVLIMFDNILRSLEL